MNIQLMDVDIEPPSELFFIFVIFLSSINIGMIMSVLVLILLIASSALISGSEIAYFSLTPEQIHDLENENTTINNKLLRLKNQPRKLLATILISNNFVNIAIVLVSDYLIKDILGNKILLEWANSLKEFGLFNSFSSNSIANALNFIIAIVGVTTILVLLGEIMPKIYANLNNLKLAKLMVKPLGILMVIFSPFSNILVKWTNIFENRLIKNKKNIPNSNKDDIEDALDITIKSDEQEFDLLKSIISFSEVAVKQIMKPRNDVFAIESGTPYDAVLDKVRESGYSRIPIYIEEFDELKGILYAKDLISHLDESNNFDWESLIRKKILYIPESKKINELLKEFQKLKLHIAIVVDEYGGNAGLITMEDIMEEILGEIFDEFDDEENSEIIKLNESEYMFEGKTSLLDFVKYFNSDISIFDKVKGEADSLAGLILEIAGEIPELEYEIAIAQFRFIIKDTSERRIEKILVKVNELDDEVS